jgi:hypothetical protein
MGTQESKALALKLYEALRESPLLSLEPPRSYSGRGMYGKHCISVDVSNVGALIAFGAELGWQSKFTNAEISEIAQSVHTDSMGRDIVVYWPHLEWDRATMQDDDDDDDESL